LTSADGQVASERGANESVERCVQHRCLIAACAHHEQRKPGGNSSIDRPRAGTPIPNCSAAAGPSST
jgi:hypothetical protein